MPILYVIYPIYFCNMSLLRCGQDCITLLASDMMVSYSRTFSIMDICSSLSINGI